MLVIGISDPARFGRGSQRRARTVGARRPRKHGRPLAFQRRLAFASLMQSGPKMPALRLPGMPPGESPVCAMPGGPGIAEGEPSPPPLSRPCGDLAPACRLFD